MLWATSIAPPGLHLARPEPDKGEGTGPDRLVQEPCIVHHVGRKLTTVEMRLIYDIQEDPTLLDRSAKHRITLEITHLFFISRPHRVTVRVSPGAGASGGRHEEHDIVLVGLGYG